MYHALGRLCYRMIIMSLLGDMRMAKLDNIQVQFKDGKLAFLIDTELAVGQTKDGSGTYFANTSGPVDVPGILGAKMSIAIWYKEPKADAPVKADNAQLKPSGLKLGSPTVQAARTAENTVKITRHKG